MTTATTSSTAGQLAELRTKLANLVGNVWHRLNTDETHPHYLLERLLDRLDEIVDTPDTLATADTAATEETYDTCQCCGGVFTLAPSRAPLCATCAQMEADLAADEPEPRRRVLVFKDHNNSEIAAAIGMPWIAYCPCCDWSAPFTAHEYALHEALRHIANLHDIHPDTGTEVPW